jgi:RNA polymerase sigma-70 factor, ECF subfamily
MNCDNMPAVKQALLNDIPLLKARAVGLCGNGTEAEDLVQEALTRAWANLSSFEPGTNMEAWLYTILRNEFYTFLRKRRFEVPDSEGTFAASLVSDAAQEAHVDLQDLRAALTKLPALLQQAILLVGASGLSYEAAAARSDCAVGTMKSRVHRARFRLMEMMNIKAPDQEVILIEGEAEDMVERPYGLNDRFPGDSLRTSTT